MQKLSYIFIVLIAVLYFGCEKEKNIQLPTASPMFTVFSIQPQNSFLTAQIGRTRSLSEPLNLYNDSNTFRLNYAIVQVFSNNTLVDTLKFNPSTALYTSTKTRLIADRTYKLVIAANGFSTAETEAVALRQTPITRLRKLPSNRVTSSGEPFDEIEITFRDTEARKNYYRVIVNFPMYMYNEVCVSSSDADLIQFESTDPFEGTNGEICYDSRYLLFTDDNFNLSTKTLRLFVERYRLRTDIGANGKVIRPSVELQNISKSYFDYLKSKINYNNSSDNPFVEPSNVLSNVKKGFGIFAPFGQSIDTIR